MKKILIELFSDFDFQLGAVGVSMTVIFPMIDQLTHVLQFFGALGGLVLLFLSIRHKMLEIEKLKKPKK